MKPEAIVYTSSTGHTARYAAMLGRIASLPVYAAEEAKNTLPKNKNVIYMGWLMASNVAGYRDARKRYSIAAVCGVGLCPTGELLKEVRKTARIPEGTPLFTLQGGMDKSNMPKLHRKMIDFLTRFMEKKKNPSEGDKAMLALLKEGGDYVAEGHLDTVVHWLQCEK